MRDPTTVEVLVCQKSGLVEVEGTKRGGCRGEPDPAWLPRPRPGEMIPVARKKQPAAPRQLDDLGNFEVSEPGTSCQRRAHTPVLKVVGTRISDNTPVSFVGSAPAAGGDEHMPGSRRALKYPRVAPSLFMPDAVVQGFIAARISIQGEVVGLVPGMQVWRNRYANGLDVSDRVRT